MEKHSLTTKLWFDPMKLLRQVLRSQGCQGLSMLLLTTLALTTQAMSAAALSRWNFDPATQQLDVTVKAGVKPKFFVMSQPARLVLDLPETELGDVKLKESFPAGAVRQVRVSQFQPGVTRIVLELAPEVELAPGQATLEAKGDRWTLRPLIVGLPAGNGATAAAPLPMGADISPVTVEPPIPAVAVPPISVKPVAPQPLQAPPPSPMVPPLAQLPTEATTPLPPTTELPSSLLTVEGQNAVTISVPPPVALPTAAPAVLPQVPAAKVTPIPAPKPAPVAPPPNLEMPTTVRSLPVTSTPQVTVPTLPTVTAPAVTPALPAAVPTPPPMAVPPLSPMAIPPLSPVLVPTPPAPVLKPPAAGVITTTGGQSTGTIRTQQVMPGSLPAAPMPAPVKVQPPASWVMQTSGIPQPPAMTVPPSAIAKPPAAPSPKVTPPPSSWVMQSSGLAQPTLTQPLPKPPVSSVMMPALPQPPASISPMPSSGVIQPTIMPSSVSPVGAAPLVSVPSLAPAPAPVSPAPAVAVPPLQPATAQPIAQPTTLPAPVNPASVIEFGQPLPTQGATSLNTLPVGMPSTAIAANAPLGSAQVTPPMRTGAVQSVNPAIALPLGTVLALSYPGTTELQIDPANPRQEMLVLQTEIRDASGAVVFPRGSYVMGRFEPDRNGSKFISSAIQRGDRIVPFFAESDPIGGGRDISTSTMALYSGAGVLAGGLVSGFSGWGLLLGGVAGAATNYFTTPKVAGSVQPGQIIPVRVLQDIPY